MRTRSLVVLEGIDRIDEASGRLCAIRDLLVAASSGAEDLHLVHPGQLASLLDCVADELRCGLSALQGDPL